MNPDIIFYLEMRLIIFELIVIALWVVFSRIPVKGLLLISVSALIIIGSLRPDNYNSDTINYASYVTSLSVEKRSAIYFITKLEPFHIFLIDLTRDFSKWLIVEGAIALIVLFLFYRRVNRSEPFILVCAFFTTLFTSSMRFSIALIVFAVLLTWRSRSSLYLAAMSAIAGCFHGVMLVTGPFASRLKWIPLVFPGAIFILAMLSTETRNRIASDLSDVKSIGLKSFAAFLMVSAYSWYKSKEYRAERAAWDFFGFTAIFLVTALFFPGLNRIIIIGAILIAMELDRHRVTLRSDSYLDRTAILLIFGMITIPYLMLTPDLYRYNMW